MGAGGGGYHNATVDSWVCTMVGVHGQHCHANDTHHRVGVPDAGQNVTSTKWITTECTGGPDNVRYKFCIQVPSRLNGT